MKAAAFDYVRAESLAQASELLTRHGEGAKLLSGGQSLLPAMNLRLVAPDLLIDLGRIPGLRSIEARDDDLRIGALTRHVDLVRSAEVKAYAPMIAAAVAHVAHPAIRNRGTIGGNLAHADPASELPACMLALHANLVAYGPNGERGIEAQDFFTGMFATALAPNEILIAIEIPKLAAEQRWTFDELARRRGDYAMVGLCACASFAGDLIEDVRLAFFSVGDRPMLARQAAAALLGGALTPERIQGAQASLASDLAPHNDLQASAATRLHLARVLLGRALGGIAGHMPGARFL